MASAQKKSKGFRIFFIFFILALVIISASALLTLWKALEVYEQCVPENTVASITEILSGESRLSYIESTCQAPLTPFESAQALAKATAESISGEITFIKKASSDDNTLTYDLKANKTKFAVLTLKKSPKKQLFGIEKWDMSNIEYTVAPEQSCIVRIPSDAKLLINGVEASDKYISNAQLPVDSFSNLPESLTVPYFIEYTVSDLFEAPSIQVLNADSAPLEAVADPQSGVYTAHDLLDESEKSTISELAEEVARTYAMFVTKDKTFASISKYLIKDSEYYKTLRHFDNSWYNDHEKTAFKNISEGNLTAYGADYISCDITFDYVLTRRGKEFVYNSSYTICFAKLDGEWKVSNILVK